MCYIERDTHNLILKFREIFPWRETVLRAHGMKSDEKLFFCQIYAFLSYFILFYLFINYLFFLRKMVHVVIDRYFPLYLKGLNAVTDSPFNLI